MKTSLFAKVLSGVALAALVMPLAASAHGMGLNINSALHIQGGKADVRGNDNDQEHKDKREIKISANANASTTSAKITKMSTRLQDIADLFVSMSGTLGAKITAANMSASTTADANAKLGGFNTSLVSAKAKAAAAATVAGSINAGNSTSTNASLVAEARTDLSGARGFLHEAQKDLMSILRFIWRF